MPCETVSMRQVHIPAFIVIYFSARALLFSDVLLILVYPIIGGAR
jgi:hypothetical protein